MKAEIDHLKTTFYKLHFVEREKQQKEYLEAGGDPEKYQIVPDEDEEVFKAEMGVIKEKRQKALAEIEEEKQENLKRKEDIIEKIKAMSVSPEEANKSYNDFKTLQQEWKNIKAVPADKSNELWHNYQLHVEQFYDMLNLNREAREYDFKKNLEAKTKLCEAAEKLADEPDVISAFHQLQDLHQQYREIGPWQRTFASRYGHALRLPAPLSTRNTSSISMIFAPRRRITSAERLSSVRELRPWQRRKTRERPTGTSTHSRL